jgi:hypothetical protein
VSSIGPGSRRLRSCLAGLIAVFLAAVAAAPASATFHLIKVSEVYPDGSIDNADFIELQMYADGQNLVGTHWIGIYNAGNYFDGPYQLPSNVANGQSQRTILIGGSGVQSRFGVTPDFVIPNLNVPSNGSVCWLSSTMGTRPSDIGLDCVSFQDGWNGTNIPSPTGNAAPAIPAGKSLTRRIDAACPTLLEGADDSDDSATDFAITDPTPRNNATPPTEKLCLPPDTTPPNTTLKKRPPNKTKDRTPTFRFSSTEAGSTFLCKLDRKKARNCTSPFTTKRLPLGTHTLKVFAVDASGNRDPSPAKDTFRVVRG